MEIIHVKEGIEPEEQILIYGGKSMEAGGQLKDYGIHANSTVFLAMRLKGGWFKKLNK